MKGPWLRPALVAATLLVLAAPACVGRTRGIAGELRVAEAAGAVSAHMPGTDATRTLRSGDRVASGTELRTGKDGHVRLVGERGALELGGETRATVLGVARVEVDIGRVLAQASGGETFRLESRGVAVRGGKDFRVDRSLGALRIGVYGGSARAELLGQGIDVPALREIVIAGGVPLERTPRPLTLSAGDRWDRRLEGDVLDFDRDVGQFGRGFNQEFGGLASAPEFYTGFVPVQSVAFLGGVIPSTDPADILVGLVFSLQLASRSGGLGSVPRTFAALQSLRDLGATWGLIAKEHGLTLRDLLRSMLDAIRRGTTPPAASGGGGGGGGPRPSPSSSPSPRPHPTTSPSPSPTPSPTPTPTCSVLDRLLQNCTQAQGSVESSDGGSGPPTCSLLGILIDPNC